MSELPPVIPYMIGGVPIHFPVKAYPSQVAMMSKIVQGLKTKQNSLLESPTGSGKTLALLCASLAWQRKEAKRIEEHNAEINESQKRAMNPLKTKNNGHVYGNNCCSCMKNAPEEKGKDLWIKPTYPIAQFEVELTDDDDDDAFLPPKRVKQSNTPPKKVAIQDDCQNQLLELQPCDKCCSTPAEEHASGFVQPEQKLQVPKIYFGTRTHKQIAQITRELRKTEYRSARSIILASRDHTCVNPAVSNHPNKNESCKDLLDTATAEGGGCLWFSSAKKFGTFGNLANIGVSEGYDLEELVQAGKDHKACPYYATRNLMVNADIIFCPYNYLIEPQIRKSMSIELEGQVVIFDEAHNMEDSSREAASSAIIQTDIQSALQDCEKVGRSWSDLHATAHEELASFLSEISIWMDTEAKDMKELDYSSEGKHWIGTEFVAFMSNIGIMEKLEIYKMHFKEIMEQRDSQLEYMKDRQRVKPKAMRDRPVITSATVMIIETIFQLFKHLEQERGKYRDDFRVALLKTTVRRRRDTIGESQALSRNVLSLNFWCLNPAIAFQDLKEQVHCIILTSGTLSPIQSFQSELGTPFPLSLEANHVIEPNQVFAGVLGCGPRNRILNGSYQTVDTYEYQDELGELINRVCRVIPHGVLCFFPSYRLLEKVIERWQITSCWKSMEEIKDIYVEPRSGNAQFVEIINSFYASIDETNEGPRGKTTGALFMAVCRGKVSEGLDFADNNARAVICVGIPFPNFKNLQVGLKREYNEKNRSRGLLSGGEWYEIQAFRALNQALGRCIRHRHDWGAILLVDDRFRKTPRYINSLSRWVRGSIRPFNSWLETENGLVDFRDQMLNQMPRPVKTSKEIDIDLPENNSGASGVLTGNNESPSSSSAVPRHSNFSSGWSIPTPTSNRQLGLNSSKSPYFTTTNSPPALFSIFAKPRPKAKSNKGSQQNPIVFDDEV